MFFLKIQHITDHMLILGFVNLILHIEEIIVIRKAVLKEGI
jgi:hypothetical protein